LANIHARVGQNIKQKHRLRRYRFGGSATVVFAFQVSAKNGLFLGQMARMPFEWSLKGYIRNDPRISHFLRLITLVASGILQSTSCTLPYGPSCRCSNWFQTILSRYSFLLLKKIIWLERIRDKNHQDDGAKRALIFNEVLKKLTVSAQKKANN
jgi:hypothetical protein